MKGLGCMLLLVTFGLTLIFPPAAAIVVPACIAIWVIAYLNTEARKP